MEKINDGLKTLSFLFFILIATALPAQEQTRVGCPENSPVGKDGTLQLSELYTDNMVLQRNRPLVISGKARAGEQVAVAIGSQKQTTRTALDGKWSVTLSALPAGGPYVLTVAAGKQSLVYKNVLIGEVWVCSGQSNMEFLLRNATTAKVDVPQAANNHIRFFNKEARWATYAVEWNVSVLDSLNRFQYYKEAQWTVCSPTTAGSFSAIAYYFGKMLQDSLQVPVGLICNAVGGSPTEAWVDKSTLEHQFPDILSNWTRNEIIQDWVRERAALNVKKSTDQNQRHPYEPCYLYEAGIRPLEQFPIKGIIWYQGESNAHNRKAHETLFRLLIESWRKNWGDDKLPFYYVQLSSLNRPSWPEFRDSQRKMMTEIPHTGMAVSSDYGDSLDVHPRVKKPIGERLARWALNQTYRMQQVVPSGPMYRKAEFRKGAAYLSFDYGEGMHTSDGQPLRTFEIAGVEGVYYPAIAEVVNNRVKVYSDAVKNPCYVRYGWQPFTRANLVNGADLPVSTFCTGEENL